MGETQVMIFALDDSEHSFYALEWLLDHFFQSSSNSMFKLRIVHARPSPSSVLGLAGPASPEMMPILELDLKKRSDQLINKAKEFCKTKSLKDVEFEVFDGDARNVMCEAVERQHASVLVMGSHGYGPLKRAVLGSVSDYCCHHAKCSVMIVKKPKPNH